MISAGRGLECDEHEQLVATIEDRVRLEAVTHWILRWTHLPGDNRRHHISV